MGDKSSIGSVVILLMGKGGFATGDFTMIFALLGTLFGHWAVVSASCSTGFAVTPDQVTLYTPMGFEDKDLPPQIFQAETMREEDIFSIIYRGYDGESETMRFTVKGNNLIDRNGYEYRRCGANTEQMS